MRKTWRVACGPRSRPSSRRRCGAAESRRGPRVSAKRDGEVAHQRAAEPRGAVRRRATSCAMRQRVPSLLCARYEHRVAGRAETVAARFGTLSCPTESSKCVSEALSGVHEPPPGVQKPLRAVQNRRRAFSSSSLRAENSAARTSLPSRSDSANCGDRDRTLCPAHGGYGPLGSHRHGSQWSRQSTPRRDRPRCHGTETRARRARHGRPLLAGDGLPSTGSVCAPEEITGQPRVCTRDS